MSWKNVQPGPLLLAGWTLDFLDLPYRRQIAWSDMSERSATMALLRLTDRDGVSGAAEATVKATWAGVTVSVLRAAVADLLIPLLTDVDLADPLAVRSRLAKAPENTLAKGLVDNALWDLRAARAGQPLWRLWSGDERAPLSWAVTRQAPEAMAAEAVEMIETFGFATLKVKGGQGADVDLAALRAIRRAVGDGATLYVDANGAYPAAIAADYCARMAEAGATHLEDPCPLLPDRAFERLKAAAPLLVDAACSSPEMAGLFLERGARALSVKPGRMGITAAWMIADRAAEAGAAAHVGLFGESAAGAVHALGVAASLPGRAAALPAETSVFLMLDGEILREPLHIAAGRVALPDVASLDALIDWDRLDRWRR